MLSLSMSPAQRLKSRRRKVTSVARKSPRNIFKLVILTLCSLLFVLCSYYLYLSWQTRIWIPGSRITVVVASKSPKIYSYNPQSGKLTILEIPQNTQIDASNSYGNWLAGGLWEFGFQEGKKGELLRSSLQKSLNLPIDGWVGENGDNLFEGKTLGWLSAGFQAITDGSTKSNLTFFDRLSILLKMGMVQSSDRQVFDLTKSGITEKTKLPDGSDGYVISIQKAKAELQFLHDDNIFSEGQRVMVVNTTRSSGLATSVAAVVGTLGARVIGTQTSNENVDWCIVRGEKEKLSTLSAKRLIKVFNCKSEIKQPAGAEDLELILGSEFAKNY